MPTDLTLSNFRPKLSQFWPCLMKNRQMLVSKRPIIWKSTILTIFQLKQIVSRYLSTSDSFLAKIFKIYNFLKQHHFWPKKRGLVLLKLLLSNFTRLSVDTLLQNFTKKQVSFCLACCLLFPNWRPQP